MTWKSINHFRRHPVKDAYVFTSFQVLSMRRRGRGKSKRKRNGDQLVDYAVTGKTVELQTAETLFRGIVAHYDTEGEIYTLKSGKW